jgi:uncharacterized protein
MLRKPFIFLALTILLAVAVPPAVGTEPKDLPKPTNYVSDFAHVLSPRAIAEVDRVCADLDHSKSDTQIAVVTVPTIDGADIATYARALANTWGVSRKPANRGVLVLLSINEHKWRIEVSRGLESDLPNSEAERIGQAMVPLLRAKDFDGAVTLAVREIAHAASGKVSANRSQW